MACSGQGITRLCAVTDFSLDIQERDCLEKMSGQLRSWGIDMLVAENAVSDADKWDGMLDIGNVLMLCRIGTTTHQMIDDAMHFYSENGMAVCGAAAFLQES